MLQVPDFNACFNLYYFRILFRPQPSQALHPLGKFVSIFIILEFYSDFSLVFCWEYGSNGFNLYYFRILFRQFYDDLEGVTENVSIFIILEFYSDFAQNLDEGEANSFNLYYFRILFRRRNLGGGMRRRWSFNLYYFRILFRLAQ